MLSVLGVDLAADFSAAVLLAADLHISAQFDSSGGELSFLDSICFFAASADVLLIEDIPPIHRFDLQAKQVCRLQGRLLERMDAKEIEIRWLQPIRWLKYFGYSKPIHRTTASFAKEKCLSFGYKPPDHVHGKALQDYRDAYLLARYGVETIGRSS